MINISLLSDWGRIKGHARAIRFSTLDRLCEVLDCQPGDLLSYLREKNSSGDKKL